MNILAIDTSNLPLSVAVTTEDKVLAECTFNVERNHSIRLIPTIDILLQEVCLTPADLDLFVVARGPGSYTGVRIGVTTAKSLAFSVGKPLVGVSSLLAIAHQVPYFDGIVLPLFDARRKRMYTAGYEYRQGIWEEVIREQVLHVDALIEELKERGRSALFLGDDVRVFRDQLMNTLGEQAHFLPMSYQLPRAAHIAQIGYRLHQAGHQEDLAFEPTYLQQTEAEANLSKGQ